MASDLQLYRQLNQALASLMEEPTTKKYQVRNATSWSYLSCVICKGLVHLEGTNYICSKCLAIVDSPMHGYKLNIDIMDKTVTTTITAFDKEAEGLVGKSVDDMLDIEKLDDGST